MNSLKGLILKDLYNLKNYKRFLLVSLLMFPIIFTLVGNITTIAGIFPAIVGMMALATFSYDETSNSSKYLLTLPASRKEIIMSKYLIIILGNIIGVVVGIIVTMLLSYFLPKFNLVSIDKVDSLQTIVMTALGSCIGVTILEEVQIPCIIKWDREKGRLQMLLIVAGIVGICVLLGYTLQYFNMFTQIGNYLDSISDLAILPFSIVILAIYYISYRISVRIYSKKEY